VSHVDVVRLCGKEGKGEERDARRDAVLYPEKAEAGTLSRALPDAGPWSPNSCLPMTCSSVAVTSGCIDEL
jgi:hypothetical protein